MKSNDSFSYIPINHKHNFEKASSPESYVSYHVEYLVKHWIKDSFQMTNYNHVTIEEKLYEVDCVWIFNNDLWIAEVKFKNRSKQDGGAQSQKLSKRGKMFKENHFNYIAIEVTSERRNKPVEFHENFGEMSAIKHQYFYKVFVSFEKLLVYSLDRNRITKSQYKEFLKILNDKIDILEDEKIRNK